MVAYESIVNTTWKLIDREISTNNLTIKKENKGNFQLILKYIR
jgi:hypothetical protein